MYYNIDTRYHYEEVVCSRLPPPVVVLLLLLHAGVLGNNIVLPEFQSVLFDGHEEIV